MIYILAKFRSVLTAFLFLGLAQTASAAVVYSGGHGDIGVAYAAPNTFDVHGHLGAGAIVDGAPLLTEQEYEPDEFIIRVPANANVGRNNVVLGGSIENYDFTSSSYNFLGTSTGGDLFLLFPDSADANFYSTPFLGFGAEEGFLPGEWTGNIVFSLTGFSGPGNFSLFSGTGTRRWDTQDGIFANDTVNIAPGGHSHFFLGFTAPGTYEVTVGVTGNHIVNGLQTGTGTFTFQVVPEPSTYALLGLAGTGMLFSVLKRLRTRHPQTESIVG